MESISWGSAFSVLGANIKLPKTVLRMCYNEEGRFYFYSVNLVAQYALYKTKGDIGKIKHHLAEHYSCNGPKRQTRIILFHKRNFSDKLIKYVTLRLYCRIMWWWYGIYTI